MRFVPLLAVLGVAVLAAGGLVAATQTPPDDPVADMNHAIHLERDLACVDCHQGVEKEARAGVPSILICVDCHEGDSAETFGGGPNGEMLADHVERKEELWWPALYQLPDHVLFSHRRHVVFGKIDCARCHGDMKSRKTLPAEPIERTLRMDGCLECHAESNVTQDCWACHK